MVKIIHDAVSAARALNVSESTARNMFRRGTLPTEFLVGGIRPAVSADTLATVDQKLANQLRGAPAPRR